MSDYTSTSPSIKTVCIILVISVTQSGTTQITVLMSDSAGYTGQKISSVLLKSRIEKLDLNSFSGFLTLNKKHFLNKHVSMAFMVLPCSCADVDAENHSQKIEMIKFGMFSSY